MTHWLLILTAATANVVLNLCLRQTARSLEVASIPEMALALLTSAWAWASVVSAAILVGAFMIAIRTFSLSLTYTAVTAIAMVSLTIVGVYLQIETVNLARVAGLGLIVAGLAISAWAG